MKLATLRTGGDGRLLVVTRNLQRAEFATAAPTLQAALDNWTEAEPALRVQAERVESGRSDESFAIDMMALDAILPRGFQFLDASAFLAHNHILAEAWGYDKRGENEPPLMYQGISHRYLSPHEDVRFADAAHQVDFEAEMAVITDAVPQGVTPQAALAHVRLLLIINDWSLRAFGPAEMKGGFGFIHAKPPTTLSAFAVTPDELGNAWRDGRVHLPLIVQRGGELFGKPCGSAMHFSFGELIAHAAATRDLCPGTIIGSGTVSNDNADEVGSACISERRALDLLAGRSATPFLADGERVRLSLGGDMADLVGVIDQVVRIGSD